MRVRRSGLVAVLLLLVLAAGAWTHRIYLDHPSERTGLIQADTYRYFHPAAVFMHRELGAGRLPLWNPHQFAGEPFLSLPVAAALYPPNLALFSLLSPQRGIDVHAIFHFFLAGLFTWLLAGRLGLSAPARLAAAGAYMLSGSMWLGTFMTVHFSTQAWLPAILLCLHGLATDGRRWRWPVGLACSVAMMLLGGYPQLFLHSAHFAAVYAIFVLATRASRGEWIGIAARLSVAILLMVGLVSPWLLPALEFTADASRSLDGLPYLTAAQPFVRKSILLDGILGYVAPFSDGSVPLSPHTNRFVLSAFFLPLWLCGATLKSTRGTWLFMTGGLITVALLMLGPQTPAYRLYYELPLVDVFRGPIRLAFLYAFAGALLMGIGIDAIVSWLSKCGLGPRAAFCVGLGLTAAVVADYHRRTPVEVLLPYLEVQERKRGAPDEVTRFFRAHRLEGRVFPVTRLLYGGSYVEKMGMMNGFDVASDYEPSLPAAYRLFFGARTNPPWHGALSLVEGIKQQSGPRVEPRILDLMSARWYLAETGQRTIVEAIAKAAGGRGVPLGPVIAFERRQALPRAYAVRRIIAEPDLESSASRIRAPDFQPRREAVVTTPARTTLAALGGEVPAATPDDTVQLESHDARRVVVQARCHEPCLLVLTDLHHRDWRARVDGRDAHIERVNVAFRGVLLEAGRHQVVFRYVPRSFATGLAGLTAALGGLFVIGVRARQARRPPPGR